MDKDYIELKDWLDATADEPLENMGAFFDERITGYEEHMACWSEHYKRVAELIPENAQTLLDIGCGTGLELDMIFARFPKLFVTGIDLSEQMLGKLREKHGNRSLKIIRADYFIVNDLNYFLMPPLCAIKHTQNSIESGAIDFIKQLFHAFTINMTLAKRHMTRRCRWKRSITLHMIRSSDCSQSSAKALSPAGYISNATILQEPRI